MTEPLAQLLAMQSPSGAFVAIVDGDVRDETCFVTAQVALVLIALQRAGPACPARDQALRRAVDFIESCAVRDLPGAFHFYPQVGSQVGPQVGPQVGAPRGFVRGLPADIDDTALAWTVLLRTEQRSKSEARAVLPTLLAQALVTHRARGDAPWVRSGILRTWLSADVAQNPPDLCANANVLSCLTLAGLHDSPISNAVAQGIAATLRQYVITPATMRLLAPYYADPVELAMALRRAAITNVPPGPEREDIALGRPPQRGLYCNAHGRPIWRSPALQLARRILDQSAAQNQTASPGPKETSDVFHAAFASR